MNGNFEALRQVLGKDGSIAIAVAASPSIDQMGAALALYLTLKDAGKNVSVVSFGQPLVEVANLVGIDKVKTSFEGGSSGDLTVSFPYKEGEIEKISYTLENNFLNIIVKASEQGLGFEERDVQFKRAGGAPVILFAIGIQKLSDLTPLFSLDSIKDTTIVNIDNRSDNQGYGDIVFVEPQASSVSEITGNIILAEGLRLDSDSSQNILLGISDATDNFMSPQTSPMAFEMSGIMMRNGARREIPSVRRDQFLDETPPVPQIQTHSQPNNRLQSQPINRGNIQREYQRENKDQDAPPGDWLEPKIFKGSTDVG